MAFLYNNISSTTDMSPVSLNAEVNVDNQYGQQKPRDSERTTITCSVYNRSGMILPSGLTPLIEAIQNNDHDAFMHYVNTCTDIRVSDKWDSGPLHWVQTDTQAAFLIAAGAEVNIRNFYGATPLHKAATAGIVALLLAAGANFDALTYNAGVTPLHYAKDADIARVLLAAGAKVNARSDDNSTPLHWARTVEHVDVLIAAGADLYAKDDHGMTALEVMCRRLDHQLCDANAIGATPNQDFEM
jgi:ankyrin repeat protein